MNSDVLYIIKAPTQDWKCKGFFRNFSLDDLKEALAVLEDENYHRTLRRRDAIRAEIDRRYDVADLIHVPVEDVIRMESYRNNASFDYIHAPARTSRFAAEWNETCLDIYRKIQFLPDIPIVAR